MSAAFERGGRAFAVSVNHTFTVPFQKANADATAEDFTAVFAETLCHSETLSVALSAADTKVLVDPETFSDSQAFAVGEAGR